MLARVFLILTLLWAGPLVAQNCEGIQSGLGANARPQNTSRDITGQSLDDIVEQGWIRFAVYEDFPPFSYKKDGRLVGVDIDLGHLIAEYLGVEARFYATAAGENVDADLRHNVWKGALIGGQISHVMLHVPYDRELACRNEQVVLTGQYFNETIAIAYRLDAYPDGGPTPAYFRFDKVGVENDTLSDFYLSGIGGGQLNANMTRYPSTEEAMAALAAGEVVAVMGARTQLEHGLRDGLAVHMPPLVGLATGTWTLGTAIRHNWRPLAYTVDDAIREAVNDGRMAALFKKHGLSHTPPEW